MVVVNIPGSRVHHLFLARLRGPAREPGEGSCLAPAISLGLTGPPDSTEGLSAGSNSGTGCRSLGPVESQHMGRLSTIRDALPRSGSSVPVALK